MPVTPTYPGVYIEEIPSGVRTITGVATSITAFIGRAKRGPVNEPTEIFNFGDFERKFGGLWAGGPMSYAVRDFFLNGGGQAIVVRLFNQQEEVEESAEEGEETPNDGDIEAPPKIFKELTVYTIPLKAISPGSWGNHLRAEIDLEVSEEVAKRLGVEKGDLFNLTVRDVDTGVRERFVNLSLKESNNRIDRVLVQSSNMVRWSGDFPGGAQVPSPKNESPGNEDETSPSDSADTDGTSTADAAESPSGESGDAETTQGGTVVFRDPIGEAEYKLEEAQKVLSKAKIKNNDVSDAEKKVKAAQDALNKVLGEQGTVTDGAGLKADHFVGSEDKKTGLYALEKTDLFNLLCIPADVRGDDTPDPVYQAALNYCVKRRAMLIVDPPKKWSANKETAATTAKKGLSDGDLGISGTGARNAVLYFPRVRYPDPLRDNQIDTFVPCGMMAGVMARTDTQRGVWKAPAGIDAGLNGTQALEVNLTNDENGLLNPLGINCLRSFPVIGRVAWGARTMRGADLLADEYKYLPVRRTALFIEESLYRGTQWVVFEPNDEPLWAQIRLNVGAFMNNLFRQGAFQGATPREAYLVKCDKETTTQNDINLGIVNIVVGFAPLKPAEFVIIKLQQLAGQIDV